MYQKYRYIDILLFVYIRDALLGKILTGDIALKWRHARSEMATNKTDVHYNCNSKLEMKK